MLTSHLLGFIPDYKGITIAEKHVTDKNVIVAAGIAVQSDTMDIGILDQVPQMENIPAWVMLK